jgi:hypothetical protein
MPLSPSREDGNASSGPLLYRRFSFSENFEVVSQRVMRYQSSSGSQMLQHHASSPAQISLGPLRDNACFRFDFQGLSLGCDSSDQACTFEITGLDWDGEKDFVRSQTTFEVSACRTAAPCALEHRVLDRSVARQFTNLTAINITLTTTDAQHWWADDVQVAWTDNECAAAACRAKVPLRGVGWSLKSMVTEAKEFLRWALRG